MFSTLEGATFQAISLELEHGDVWELGRGNLEEFCNVWQYDFSIRKFGFPNQEIPSGNTVFPVGAPYRPRHGFSFLHLFSLGYLGIRECTLGPIDSSVLLLRSAS